MQIENLNILLVEDELMGQMMVDIMLKGLGVKYLDIVGTGTEAIAAAKDKVYDIYLVDIGLPDIDGFQVMQEISKLRGKDAPMFVLTGHSEPEYKIKSLEVGAKGVFIKPLQEGYFWEIIELAKKIQAK